MIKGVFQVDEIRGQYYGWHDPDSRWNGFAIPYFTKEVGIQIINEIDKGTFYMAQYLADQDAFEVLEYDYEEEQLPLFSFIVIDTGSNEIDKVYPICSKYWRWSEIHDFDKK